MSGTLPINDFSTVVIKNNTPTATSIALSGRRQSRQLAAQYWTIDAEFAPLTRSRAAQIMAFLNLQNNSLDSFNVIIPQYSWSDGDIKYITTYPSPTLSVSASAAIGATAISIDFDTITSSDITAAGGSASTTFRAGDFIKFNNHNKVYQLTADVSIDGSGAGTMTIFPGLFSAITTSTDVLYNSVPFTVFNTEQSQEYQFTVGNEAAISLKLHEAL
jgi:hypothetical protein